MGEDNQLLRDNGKYKVNQHTGFNEVNHNNCLKYVLVGITPGNNQTKKSKKEMIQKGILFGTIEYKYLMAFRGKTMRNNLNRMFIKINRDIHKGVLRELIDKYGDDINTIFEYKDDSIIDFTSLLKDATYKKNSSGEYKMFNNPDEIDNYEILEHAYKFGFESDYNLYYKNKNLVFIACGKKVYKYLKDKIGDNEKLIAIVHPSGQANSYIKEFEEGTYNPEDI